MTSKLQDSAIRSAALAVPVVPPASRRALVVMGVSGCGKSSVAEAVAATMGWTLLEGDSYHSPENVAKMRAGTPLTDDDRGTWLDQLAGLLASPAKTDPAVDANANPHAAPIASGQVMTCSALRRQYRDRLRAAAPGLGFAFLRLDYADALARVQSRPGHFFSPALVADQFATLESPDGEEGVLTLDATDSVADLSAQICRWLQT